MAWTLVQEKHDFSYSVSGIPVLTFDNPVTEGNLIVAWCTSASTSGYIYAGDGFHIWNPIVAGPSEMGYGYQQTWYAIAQASRSVSVSFLTASGNIETTPVDLTYYAAQIMEFSGNSLNPLETTHQYTGNSTAPYSSITTENNSDLVVAFGVPGTYTDSLTETTGWMNAAGSEVSSSAIFASVGAAGTYTPTFLLNPSDAWGVTSVSFISASSGYTISGSLGSSAAGAQIRIVSNTTGYTTFVTADASGGYISTDLPNDTYFVQPQLAGFVFSPYANTSVNISSANVTGVDFTANSVPTNIYFQTLVSDSFQRANESPLNPENWSVDGTPVPPEDNGLQLVDNEVELITVATEYKLAVFYAVGIQVWTGTTLPGNQFVEFQLDYLNPDSQTYAFFELGIRNTSVVSEGYYLRIKNNGDGTAQIGFCIVEGGVFVPTQPANYSNTGIILYSWLLPNEPFSYGDKFRFACLGNVFYIFHNGKLIGTFSDTTYSVGYGAIILGGSNLTDVQVSHFIGGQILEDPMSTQLASDNFTRANENPLSDGGNWTTQGGGTALQVVSNVCEATALDDICIAYWSAISWPNDQYSEITLDSFSGGDYLVAGVRMGNSSVSNTTGYFGLVEGSGNIYIQLRNGGTTTNLATGTASISQGDVFRLSIQGTSLTFYQNGTSVLTATDSTLSSGYAGFFIFTTDNLSLNTTSLWAGGDFSSGGATTSWLSINLNPTLKGAKH